LLPLAETNHKWGEAVDQFTFQQTLPVLKTEAAVKLVAQVMGTDVDQISPERVAALQDSLLGGGQRPTSNNPEGSKPPSRRKKTELDREITERNRDAIGS
jgi:hypothetical protein